ncbi:hypothetical protein [Planctopirus hydrillae]|uniref:hypothetical protein n=1 Tax=Planctopirus hydrillae TaxID=1841610 RepID=UPI0013F4C7E8|nr:hypothetical protein [Planctopirus hydrillae]
MAQHLVPAAPGHQLAGPPNLHIVTPDSPGGPTASRLGHAATRHHILRVPLE